MANNELHTNLHRVVGNCLVYRKDPDAIRFLALKRCDDLPVYPGKWSVPGGGVKRDDYEPLPKTSPDGWENPVEITTLREIDEEAGVLVGPLQYLSHFAFIRPDGIPVIGFRYAAEYVGGEVVLDKDSTEFEWLTADEAQSYDFLGSIPAEMKALDARMKAGTKAVA